MDLLEIRTQALRKLDQDVTATNDFWKPEELTDYVNDAYNYYWQWLLNAKYQVALVETFLDITANQAEIALPDNFHTARLVERVVAEGTIPLWWDERFEEANYTAGIPSTTPYYTPTIRFVRNNILLEPTPDETITNGIKLTYWFYPDPLVLDTDVPDVALKPIYHDLLVYRTVVIAKAKEEAIGQGGAPLGGWGTLVQEKEQRFKETIERPTVQRMYTKPFGAGMGSFNTNYY